MGATAFVGSLLLGAFAPVPCIAAEPSSFRSNISLNGTWQTAANQDPASPPGDNAWKPITLPEITWTGADGGSHFLWYRRDLEIPADWVGRRVFLDARGIRYAPCLYVDGKQVAEQFNGWTPFTVEITKFVQPGRTARIMLRCSDRNANLNKSGKLIMPSGGYKDNIGVADDIVLRSKPAEEIADPDLVITPSVRRQSLTVTGTADGVGGNLTVEADVEDKGAKVVSLGSAAVDGDQHWTLTAPFRNAHYWSPEAPHLYLLHIRLRRGANGPILDEYTQLFGFKEIWTDGPDFYLNGSKRHLLGTAAWPVVNVQSLEEIRRVIRDIRNSNAIAFRLHNQIWREAWLEEADRQGLLIIDETPMYTDEGGKYDYKDPQFWKNYRDLVSGMIRRDRNHASLAMWSLGNEILFMGNQKFDQDLPRKEGDLGRYAKSIDPSHPITFEADQDPDGAYDVIGLHYPHESPWFDDYPNTSDWLGTRTVTRAQGGMLGTTSSSFFWERKKPLYIGEYLWMPQRDYSNSSIFFGDRAYLNHDKFAVMAQAQAFYDQTIGYRRSGVSGISPWTAFGFGGKIDTPALYAIQTEMFRPVAAYLRNRGLRYFSGERAALDFDVFCDDGASHRLTLKLLQPGGGVIATATQTMQSGGSGVMTLSYDIPQVSARKELAFDSVLYADGREISRSRHTLSAFPRRPLDAPNGFRLAVFDPSGKWPGSVSDFSALPLADPARTILLIAPGALDVAAEDSAVPVVGTSTDWAGQFRSFLRRGGRAVVLEQQTLAPLNLGLTMVTHKATMTFPLRESHPILAGLTAGDLSFWRDDNYVTQTEIKRPVSGGGAAVAVTGGPDGLDRAPILDLRYGNGRVILLQALVGAKRQKEPAAAVILQNAVDALGTPNPTSRTASIHQNGPTPRAVISAADPAFMADIAKLGVGIAAVGNDFAGKNLVLDGAISNIEAEKARIGSVLSQGGTVYWHAPDPASFATLRNTLGASGLEAVRENAAASIAWRDDPLLDGVSREDVTYVSTSQAWDRPMTPLADAASVNVLPSSDGPELMSIPATSARIEGGGINSDGKTQVTLSGPGAVHFVVAAPKEGVYLIVTKAGAAAENDDPILQIETNEAQSTMLTIRGRELRDYRTLIALKAGANDIALRLQNPAAARSIALSSVAVRKALYPSGAQVHVIPGALVTWPAAGGRVVVDGMAWNRPGDNAIRGARYASALLANLGFAFEETPVSNDSAIPLTGFKLRGESPYFDQTPDTITLRTNGVVEAPFICAEDGKYELRLSGYSTPYHGDYADVRISVDGQDAGKVTVKSSTTATFPAGPIALSKGKHTVALSFTNDAGDDKEDRNLFLKGVTMRPIP